LGAYRKGDMQNRLVTSLSRGTNDVIARNPIAGVGERAHSILNTIER